MARPTHSQTKVYPRVCGGTLGVRPSLEPMPGLSPRVRGNLALRAEGRIRGRSIPACAGEPAFSEAISVQ